MSAGTDSNNIDAAAEGLLEYCTQHGVTFSSRIASQQIPGRGLGIYSIAPIRKGEKLMVVPAKALLTTRAIPNSFLSQAQREELPVHAQLAAYLTLGLAAETNPYERWMATWPALSTFTATMPMLWPEQIFRSSAEASGPEGPKRPRLRITVQDKKDISVLPPPTTGVWSMASTDTLPAGSTPVATAQRLKLNMQLSKIAAVLPEKAKELLSPTSPLYWRFVHMWCLVNTRCFYYLHPRQTKPADPNEAMAMCPGMDLFNHTDQPGCTTKHNQDGFTVIADRDYVKNEEILLSYGVHTNDVLWAEYGFMLDKNADDGVRIDEIVLRELGWQKKNQLKDHDYLGDYWLSKDGPCWRTNIVAYAQVTANKDFKKIMEGKWEPNYWEDRCERRHEIEIGAWLQHIDGDCEQSIERLEGMSKHEIIDMFVEDEDVLLAQGIKKERAADLEFKHQLAQQRSSMCVSRWKQIKNLSENGLQLFPGPML